MNKVIFILAVCLIVFGTVGIIYSYNDVEEVENNMEEVYQGPVPQDYSLEHFRKTGETIKEVEN